MRGKVPVLKRVVRIGLTRRVRFETYRDNKVSQTDRVKKHSSKTAHPEASTKPHVKNSTEPRVRKRDREERKVKTEIYQEQRAEGLIHQGRTFLLNEMRKPLQNKEISPNAKWLSILKYLSNCYVINRQNPSGSVIKNLPSMQETKETGVQSLDQDDPWSKKWQTAPVFLPGKFHEQRSLAGYSPWGLKESDTTK